MKTNINLLWSAALDQIFTDDLQLAHFLFNRLIKYKKVLAFSFHVFVMINVRFTEELKASFSLQSVTPDSYANKSHSVQFIKHI